MPSLGERSALRLGVRAFVAVLLLLAAIPAYLTLAPAWRPPAARLACAALLMVVCVRVIRSVRTVLDEHSGSALDARVPRTQPPELDERFVRLRDELVFSVRSRRYFEGILWPQLQRLGAPELPTRSARRRLRRDGPSLATLAGLIAGIEERA